MSTSFHSNPGPIFPCLVCVRNVTWKGRSLQCSTCSKWIHLRCSLLSSRWKTLGISHSWRCLPCCVSAYSDGFSKPKPGSWTIDFSIIFDFVWHPALFRTLISAGLSSYFACWTQSFLSDWRACMVFQNQKSSFYRVRRGAPQGSDLGHVFLHLFINDLSASLPC